MRLTLVAVPVLLALGLAACNKKQQAQTIGEGSTPAGVASAASSGSPLPTVAPITAPTSPAKVAVDQTAQVIVYGYHRFVNQVRRPDTEITPQMFEQQMQELKNRGITVIGMQDFLAWKGGEAVTWEQLAEMRDAGIDIQAHSETHQDLRKPYDKVAKKKLSPPEYEQWLQNEVGRCKETLEQRLGIKVNCFAVPYGFYNQHIKDVAKGVGYEAVFTVYGQPITFRSSVDSLGRYLIEGNKPKVFVDAISMIATSSGGGAPVAEFGASNIASKPADGETIRNPLPLISANLSAFGAIDLGSVTMRVSGLGVVPASFDPKTNTVSYQVTKKLRDKCSVIVEAKSGGKKVEAHWTFAVEEGGAAASPSVTPKK